jgi:thymidylate synthase ThyX
MTLLTIFGKFKAWLAGSLHTKQERLKVMPNVKLISYTGHGHPDRLYAAKLLAFTKSTRLNMDPEGFDAFMSKSELEIMKELEYMAGTIPSSWEFGDLTFLISQVSRATAQQITRTRTASFAMQSQRVTDMSKVTWDKRYPTFDARMEQAIESYSEQVATGLPLEDARDLLPVGVHCNLVAKYNFRTVVETCIARESIRVQGSYREVVQQMRAEVLRVWPWAATFFRPREERALEMLQEVAKQLSEAGAVYKGPAGQIAKAIDLIKKG